jgi:hypothetical protein
MSEIEYLRDQAKRCFRLIRMINHPQAIVELEKMARELEERAARLEADGG